MTPQKEDLTIGSVLQSRYRIDSKVGGGSMGAVYRAWDTRLEKYWALKGLQAEGKDAGERREILERFKQEAHILSKLQHPKLPRVVDYFSEGGGHYLVMDFIEGRDLETLLAERGKPGLPEKQVVSIACELLDVLSYLHIQNPPVLYRDMKPSNIMRKDSDGSLFLVDFGIARMIQGVRKPGTAIGTEGYSPPEQYEGKTEPRSDLYALAATMHHLLTGTAPQVPFQFSRIGSISPSLQRCLDRALENNPAARFSSAAEMKHCLESPALPAVPGVAAPAGSGASLTAGSGASLTAGSGASLTAPLPPSSVSPRKPPPKPRSAGRRLRIAPVISVVLALLVIAALFAAVFHLARPFLPASGPWSSPHHTGIAGDSPAEKEVRKALFDCMKAMEARDLKKHMSYYAGKLDIYYKKKGCTRDFIYRDKQKAIDRCGRIKIVISRLKLTMMSPDTSSAVFDKEWDCSNGSRFSGKEKQRLTFRKMEGIWKIVGEEELEVYWVKRS
jgi:serine/threonine protein kinase